MQACAIRSPLGGRGLEHALPKEHRPGAAEKKTGETLYRLGGVLIPLRNKCQSRLEIYVGSKYSHYFVLIR
jgi:hypothetical protein